MSNQLDLLDWTPPACRIIPFPLTARIGRIRDVAEKLSTKSEKQAEFYVRQVVEGMFAHLDRFGISHDQQDEMISAFMRRVYLEAGRLERSGQTPGGGAA